MIGSLSTASQGLDARAPVLRLAGEDLTAADVFGFGYVHGDRRAVEGRAVLVATRSQAAAALALLFLDGVARRLILVPPGVGATELEKVAAQANVDAVVCDPESWQSLFSSWCCLSVDLRRRGEPLDVRERYATEWVLLTSGTTGAPKAVVHTLQTLAGAIPTQLALPPVVRGTFYDIRRYGGLQIFLRAMFAHAPLVLPEVGESTDGFLGRACECGLGYLSGTPSHWRAAMMGSALTTLALRDVRLSGEIADQTLLERLGEVFCAARVVHAFASTEAGVAFEVTDGREGFPATLLENTHSPVDLRVEQGTLRIRSPRTALRVLGAEEPVRDAEGFVDTRDLVQQRVDRCYFVGRRDGVINTGGNKVHPEEIEALLNAHPRVQMARARARKSSILGALIEVDIVPRDAGEHERITLVDELQHLCAANLPLHKRPAAIRLVPSLSVSTAGKLERSCD